MPELPEVEVTRRALVAAVKGGIVGRTVVRCERLRDPVPDLSVLTGLKLTSIQRRAKYLIWHFHSSDGCVGPTMVTHLGMSGVWRIWPQDPPTPKRHDHVDIEVSGTTLRLSDPRRFGSVRLYEAGVNPLEQPPLSELGAEPFDPMLTVDRFHAALKIHHAHIKQVLLSGRVVVGVGNIYCSESLFAAGIHPKRRSDRISKEKAKQLLLSIRSILTAAIEAGGTTLRDFHGPDGSDGYFALSCRVYDREGLPCQTCATPIRRIEQNARSTYYCPNCQH